MGAEGRERYAAWEREVIAAFWGKRGTPAGVVPRPGAPVRAVKSKTVVAVDLHGASARVAASEPDLPPKHKLMLYHAGLKRPDAVSAGFDAESGTWFHPACDTGGLTNVRQKLGESSPFLRGAVALPAVALPAARAGAADIIYKTWLDGRAAFRGPARAGLRRWVQSFPADATGVLRVARFPKERRVIVCPRDVLRAAGKYYMRVYGSETEYAREATPAELRKMYMAVSETYVTPNLNRMNLENEYVAGR